MGYRMLEVVGQTHMADRQWACLLAVLGSLWLAACTPEEEITTDDASVQLLFSQDTIQFDTLFSTVGSTSQPLKVYNPHRNAVTISTIETGRGTESSYTAYVNGQPGQRFQNIRLLGGDSLYVLVEVLIDPQDQNLPFLVKDSLVFQVNGNLQDVKLEAWGQDAHFHPGWVITQDTALKGERPFVILDSLWINPEVTVTVDSGARFFFENGAFALIQGSLQTSGTVNAPVIFRNIRTDGAYENALGQWDGLTFTASSRDNKLRHTIVRNAINGIIINTPDADTIPDLTLANSIVENMAGYGIVAIGSDVEAYNTLVHSCILGLAYNVGRGYYRYRHCTFDNSSLAYPREEDWLSLAFSDTISDFDVSAQAFYGELTNSIVWGNFTDELLLVQSQSETDFQIKANLIKSSDDSLEGNIYNEDPLFVDPVIARYALDSLSPAIDQGINTGIKQDLMGESRGDLPDLGAFEYRKP
ncbi:MAG: choice-of-anchor Q domain-containing protein [Cyclobacteriaceae bacterium]